MKYVYLYYEKKDVECLSSNEAILDKESVKHVRVIHLVLYNPEVD